MFGLVVLLVMSSVFATFAPSSAGNKGTIAFAESDNSSLRAGDHKQAEHANSWLLKWHDASNNVSLPDTEVLHSSSGSDAVAVEVVRPANNKVDTNKWLRQLRELDGVEYVHPNNPVTLLAASSGGIVPNDPELPKQHYLEQIGAREAWATVREQTSLTIALVDTGVDLDHPDLKDNLVQGTNLVSPGKLPQDDNGHGTSVAGVLAGVGNNGTGIVGLLWKAKIMPIKALDTSGYGDEERLGKAILYAVNNGARIVVLSVGLYRYSPYLEEITSYAENKGVLLVAASGNDGVLLGSRAAVKYPAAYPSVLAVAGVKPDNAPEPQSNPGPEIDLAAPWHVFTTALGGGYKKEQGTSMAAPQAAAAAALIWAVHPAYKPYQIRETLRQSAKDVGPAGIDEQTGYGLLQVGQALSLKLKPDAYEPNETRSSAKKIPLSTMISAQLTGGSDKDWYAVDVPYDGLLSVRFNGMLPAGQAMPPFQMVHDDGSGVKHKKDTKLGNQTVVWNVKKGRNYLLMQLADSGSKVQLPYLLTATFKHAPDAYENNDKQHQAFTLSPRSQSLVGNFHQIGDRDWYAIRFEHGGTLQVKVTPDSVRMDPALAIGRQGDPLVETDENSEGDPEFTREITVTPGLYYIRVHDAMSAQASPTTAQYTLDIKYQTKYTDPNEPNDKIHEATTVQPGSTYAGVIGSRSDVDWFQVRLSSQSMVNIAVTDIPKDIRMKAQVYDKHQALLAQMESGSNGQLSKEQQLEPGVYYVKLSANAPFDKQYYKLRIQTERMVAGFRDIAGHWAEQSIVGLAKRGVVGAAGDNRFNPDRSITRAEVVAMLARALKPKGSTAKTALKDVPARHWASDVISQAVNAGWVGGYPDGTFGPDQAVTREEMAAILARAFQLKVGNPTQSPFADIKLTRWSVAVLSAMKQKQWIGGYPGNLFKPDGKATRSEFATVLQRALGS